MLRAYDEQLRGDAEVSGAASTGKVGPVRLARFAGGRGFVGYGGADAADWVEEVVAHYRSDPETTVVEWKTRGHDVAPGLLEALLAHGFVPDEPESIMIGEARLLAVDVELPDGVTLRRIEEEADVRAMCAMQDVAFESDFRDYMAADLLERLARGDGTELWVAETGGEMISAGRLEPVPGTEFASIWGGSTLPAWRRQGIYRALTAERARSAIRLGKRLLHSDSTEFSRPILERAGFVRVSTTTPYELKLR